MLLLQLGGQRNVVVTMNSCKSTLSSYVIIRAVLRVARVFVRTLQTSTSTQLPMVVRLSWFLETL